MYNMKRLHSMFVVLAITLLVTGCGGNPPTQATQATPVTPLALEIGSSFTSGSYDVKLIQVSTWPTVTFVNPQNVRSIPPSEGQDWLTVALEVSSKQAKASMSLGELVSSLALTSGDSVVVDAAGEKHPLSAVGCPTRPEQGWFMTRIQEQTPASMIAIMVDPIGGSGYMDPNAASMFALVPNPLQDGHMDFGNNSCLSDPTGPKWHVGIETGSGGTDRVIPFSLLFAVPKTASGLEWQFLGSPLTKLPLPTVGSISVPTAASGFSMTSFSLTQSEMCKAWNIALPCR
jgi:hypothetical protein